LTTAFSGAYTSSIKKKEKEEFMKKTIVLVSSLLAAVVLISGTSYSWNYATHVYIAERIGKGMPLTKANEMYGIVAPDIFNLEFSLMDDNVLRGYTHGIPKGDPDAAPSQAFMAVWWKANWGLQKPAALGYVAHNDAWGADYIAHWKAIPSLPQFPPPYQDEHPGYIIALAVELDKILEAQDVWHGFEQAGISLGISERMMYTENVMEYAGDILIKRADPLIGQKIWNAALLRTPEFPGLLKKAFPPQYAAFIEPAEETFRQQMILYGGLLLADEETIKVNVANQIAGFAIDYLEYKFQALPGSFEEYRSTLINISYGAMTVAVQICEQARYMDEVRATIYYVKLQLLLHRISYFWLW
jgi:hypothetical protein